jgi:outer membrane immunogenic protein
MRQFGTLAIAVLIALSPAVAKAADPIAIPTSGNDSLPVADAGFNWDGFYAGVYGAGRMSAVDGAQIGLGVDLGVNARLEFVLVGGEVAVEGLTGSTSTIYGEAVGKAGILLSDNLVLYGAAGLGTDFGAQSDVLFGGGLDVAVSDTVSIDARYLDGAPITGANPKDQVTVGAKFHF